MASVAVVAMAIWVVIAPIVAPTVAVVLATVVREVDSSADSTDAVSAVVVAAGDSIIIIIALVRNVQK